MKLIVDAESEPVFSGPPPIVMRLICRDCDADVTPTLFNGEGWLFHAMAGHRIEEAADV